MPPAHNDNNNEDNINEVNDNKNNSTQRCALPPEHNIYNISLQNGRQKVLNIVCSMQGKQLKTSMTGNRLGGDHFIARFCDNFLPDCPETETAPHPSPAALEN